MVYLLLAIASSMLVSVTMRFTEGKIRANLGMLAMNYLMCFCLAAYYTGVGRLLPKDGGLPLTLGMGVFNGFLYFAGFVLMQKNVYKCGVVLTSTFMKLGLLVPIVVSVILFGELPTAVQAVGFLLALAAIVLISRKKDETSVGFHPSLIIMLLAGGSGDAMSKVFEQLGPAALSEQFLFYTFVIAFLFCIAYMRMKGQRPGKAEVGFGLLLGIPNYYSARFLLLALTELPAVIVYPTFSVGTIIAITAVGILFFRERLAKHQWLAVGIILAALVLLNV